jgi:penicillin-binding protein 1C
MNAFLKYIHKHRLRTIMILAALLLLMLIFFLPPIKFDTPASTVVFDRNGQLIGAQIASDGQWRFASGAEGGEKFETCLLLYEDRYFYRHPGFNPFSIARAARQNIQAGRVVSGGSTITMQVARLWRKDKPRNLGQKAIEFVLSIHAELHYSKSEILRMYVSNAPFGGNVVGLDAAAWRYFGRSPRNLSWAEAACLAVLPNAPALIHPGRNRELLKEKRDHLLEKLFRQGAIDPMTFRLACDEPVPASPLPLPSEATHLTAAITRSHPENQVHTTLDAGLQSRVNRIVERHHGMSAGNGIHSAAVLVLDMATGEVRVYVGNTRKAYPGDHANQVDIIRRPRSSGSLLKPFLYAAMLSEGEILPNTLVPDIPTTIGGFTPKNFNVTYDGAVPARDALIRSLNIPAVRMLSDFGQQRFHSFLMQAGFSTLSHPARHYGLSLILGGAEITLWDICAAYHAMAGKLLRKNDPHLSGNHLYSEPSMVKGEIQPGHIDLKTLDEAAIFLTLDAMKDVHRPDAEAGWRSFSGSLPIAWKTGTSFGFRDAWAIGLTTEYLVGVWVGNASGEGRPGLTGLLTAAPIMFEVFDLLPESGKWFEPPRDKMAKITVCRQSGMRPSMHCTDIDTVLVNTAAHQTAPCPYHRPVHLNNSEDRRVTADCYPADKIVTRSWFELPPAMAWFYQSGNPFYKPLPPWLDGCGAGSEDPMQLVWPDKPGKIFLPLQHDGTLGEIIFEIAHAQPETDVYWYLNDQYLGKTRNLHKTGIQPPPGHHQLILMDEHGNIFTRPFEVVNK